MDFPSSKSPNSYLLSLLVPLNMIITSNSFSNWAKTAVPADGSRHPFPDLFAPLNALQELLLATRLLHFLRG